MHLLSYRSPNRTSGTLHLTPPAHRGPLSGICSSVERIGDGSPQPLSPASQTIGSVSSECSHHAGRGLLEDDQLTSAGPRLLQVEKKEESEFLDVPVKTK